MSTTTNHRRLGRLACLVAGVASAAMAIVATPAQAASEPRYVVSVTQIRAIQESFGGELFFSDDVYGGFRIVEPTTRKDLGSFRSAVLKDFDSGETKTLAGDMRCAPAGEILVAKSGQTFLDARGGDRWLCQTINVTNTGLTAPFTVDGVLHKTETCLSFENCSVSRDNVLGKYNRYDLHLGSGRLAFSAQGLAADLTQVGQQRIYQMNHSANDARYRSSITVQRVA